MTRTLLILLALGFFACSQDDEEMPSPIPEEQVYFPPKNSDAWERTTPESLDWDQEQLNELYEFLALNNTRAFIILKDGKIVVERYWGNNILDTAPFDRETNWYWASAGKTLTAFLVGLAQEKGLLAISDKTSDFLGEDWTSLPPEKEVLITIKSQLSMTTGLDYQVPNPHCTDPSCLLYKTDAGAQWFYHNAPYTLLEKVVSNASGSSYNQFTDNELELKIGMNGQWIVNGFNNVYWSTARDAARFGWLIINQGRWEEDQIMTDATYFEDMITSSQSLNPAYGYLWWLNGKSSIIVPGLPISFNRELAPSAPTDLFAAMGKNGQFIDVVPSENLVVVRMGEAPDDAAVPIQFHDDMWAKITMVIRQ